MKLVGCDVGGTFTDLVYLDDAAGEVRVAKVPTTVDNQAFGFLAALVAAEVDVAGLDVIVHGTTTSTNALLERKIALTGLITTRGFRDVLELGRRTRPNPYGLLGSFRALITREYRLEVDERMDARGEVLTALDEDQVLRAAESLRDRGCESLVIHFLHAYANPSHERRAAEIAAAVWPNGHITTGSSVLSEYREFERGVAAAVNASIRPVIGRYLSRLRDELGESGFHRDVLVMQGNGGTVSSPLAIDGAINTVMSGPASGVIAAAWTAARCGHDQVITYDMGGTSSDVGLIRDGIPGVSSERELEYAMPIHVPMVDVHSIGAGGGSIASIDDAGMLQVGPQSAGADPGPICYGRGGTNPTITDANLLLGRLNPGSMLAVDRALSFDSLAARIGEVVGEPLGLDAYEAAAAIVQVANHRMAGAIRMVSLARGHDPREYALFAFGGAGPLHAVALARELAIPKVLIPPRPGITNAIGCMVADIRHDFTASVNVPLQALDMSLVRRVLGEQVEQGREVIEQESVDIEELLVVHTAQMQYEGQSHMLKVSLPSRDISLDELQAAFDDTFFARFALRLPTIRAVLVSLHTGVIGRRPSIDASSLIDISQRDDSIRGALSETRRVWFESGWADTPVYRREKLPAGAKFAGPAIIEQMDSTTVVEPDNGVQMDEFGSLHLEVASAWVD